MCQIIADVRNELIVLRLDVYVVVVKPDRMFQAIQMVADCNVRDVVL